MGYLGTGKLTFNSRMFCSKNIIKLINNTNELNISIIQKDRFDVDGNEELEFLIKVTKWLRINILSSLCDYGDYNIVFMVNPKYLLNNRMTSKSFLCEFINDINSRNYIHGLHGFNEYFSEIIEKPIKCKKKISRFSYYFTYLKEDNNNNWLCIEESSIGAYNDKNIFWLKNILTNCLDEEVIKRLYFIFINEFYNYLKDKILNNCNEIFNDNNDTKLDDLIRFIILVENKNNSNELSEKAVDFINEIKTYNFNKAEKTLKEKVLNFIDYEFGIEKSHI